MRIAVLAGALGAAGGLSVGQNILSTLPRVAPMNEYLFVIPRGWPNSQRDYGPGNVTVLETHPGYSNPRRAIESILRVPRALRTFRPELIWSLGNVPVRRPPCRQALLIQDAHLFYPEAYFSREVWYEKLKKRTLSRYLRTHLDSVDLVFCQTQTAARRFSESYEFENVAVMPNAVSDYIQRSKDPLEHIPARMAKYANQFRIMALTKYYSHKNLELIVEAYSRHSELMEGTVCFITIDASRHPGARQLRRRVAKETPDRVVNLGPPPQTEIQEYFRGVDALIQPTTLESFSATYLEAMAFSIPIMTSDLDFAHEVCGDAAVYFNPRDSLDMAHAVATLRDDVQARAALAERGAARLEEHFSDWSRVVRRALETLGVEHV